MRYVFKATRFDPNKEDGIWFDSNQYTLESAKAQFKHFKKKDQNGFSYTGYVYEGIEYRNYIYLGLYEDNKMPTNNEEYLKSIN